MKSFTFTIHVDPEGEIIVSLCKPNSINKHGEDEKLLISKTLNFIGKYIVKNELKK